VTRYSPRAPSPLKTQLQETSHPSAAERWAPGPSPPPAEQSGWVSYAHPWASGPCAWISKWLVGVRPLEAGYGRLLIAPHVARSMAGVSGRAPTPHGAVALNLTGFGSGSGAAEARLELKLPDGVREAIVRFSSVTLARLLRAGAGAGAGALDLAGLSVVAVAADGSEALLASRVVAAAEDAPLADEADVRGGRAPSLELVLALRGGRSYSLRVRVPAAAAAAAAATEPWAPLGSPFPPPAWPGQFLGADSATQGSWLGKLGADGYLLVGFDKPQQVANPFCGSQGEGSSLQLQCNDAGAIIDKILFASFGNPSGACPALAKGSCNAPNSTAVVAAACVGKRSCAVDVSNANFGGDPCAGTPKSLAVVAHCSSGGGSQPGGGTPPQDRALMPSYVTSARVVDYDGYCGSRDQWTNATADVRALQDPADASRRALGYSQPCGCPTSPVDILLTDAAKAAGKRFKLSVYFVDFAPSVSCGGLDGTARSQETYLLTGYPDLSPLAPRQALADFAGGVWLSYAVSGDVRVRISTQRGDMAVLSALAFDPLD
jgi:hypothetical protein